MLSPSYFNCWKNFYQSSYLKVGCDENVEINTIIFNRLDNIRVW